jgi:hypothetical protein
MAATGSRSLRRWTAAAVGGFFQARRQPICLVPNRYARGPNIYNGIVDHTRVALGVIHARLLELAPGRSGRLTLTGPKTANSRGHRGPKGNPLRDPRNHADRTAEHVTEHGTRGRGDLGIPACFCGGSPLLGPSLRQRKSAFTG